MSLKIELKCIDCNTVLSPNSIVLYKDNSIKKGASYDDVVVICDNCNKEHVILSQYSQHI